ncbi:putative inorganic phosphate cotransporter isoform X1 [Neodiprion virginianus]|uniref:putative inorganic phosphate cotransporter isoform X1 n=1 Tax=Neodiprion virginianus TaxID=2961670 RepID=UPI001EE73A13|nr:putative inorganic phosphate cotransporter isoform X1 [Neodiprion virginianus]
MIRIVTKEKVDLEVDELRCRTVRREGGRISQRWILAVMGCLAIANAVMMRVCLSVAITEIVTKTEMSNDTSLDDTCPASESTSSSTSSTGGTYEWSEYMQGIVLSSFAWGYAVAQIPGAMMVAKFGGKWPLGISILTAGVLTLLTPTAIQIYDAKGLIVLHVLMGVSGGVVLPSLSFLTAHWASPNERSKIGNTMTSGGMLGTIASNALSGVLIENSSIGWPIVFYFFGGFSMIWFIAWSVLCYSRPEDHPFITEKEKKHLMETTMQNSTGMNQRENLQIPWRRIMSSRPFWAVTMANISHDWGSFVMLTNLPKYLSSVLKYSIQSNGLLSALPFAAKWLVINASSWLADWLIKAGKLSRTNTRKIFVTIGGPGMAFFLIGASYAGCNRELVVTLFVLGMGVMGNCYPGSIVNIVDLSPNYAGTLMGIMKTMTALTGIAAPYAIGVLTPNHTLSEWRIVFWITVILFFTATLIFVIWGDGEVQSWNHSDNVDGKRTEVANPEQADEENISLG